MLTSGPSARPPQFPRFLPLAEIERAIEAEHSYTHELLAELLAHIERAFAKKIAKVRAERDGAKTDLADETRRLRFELAELQTVAGELRQALAHERGKPLDPPSLAAGRVN